LAVGRLVVSDRQRVLETAGLLTRRPVSQSFMRETLRVGKEGLCGVAEKPTGKNLLNGMEGAGRADSLPCQGEVRGFESRRPLQLSGLSGRLGVDSDIGKERWAAKTVQGYRRHATARLREFVEEAGYARLPAGAVAPP